MQPFTSVKMKEVKNAVFEYEIGCRLMGRVTTTTGTVIQQELHAIPAAMTLGAVYIHNEIQRTNFDGHERHV